MKRWDFNFKFPSKFTNGAEERRKTAGERYAMEKAGKFLLSITYNKNTFRHSPLLPYFTEVNSSYNFNQQPGVKLCSYFLYCWYSIIWREKFVLGVWKQVLNMLEIQIMIPTLLSDLLRQTLIPRLSSNEVSGSLLELRDPST